MNKIQFKELFVNFVTIVIIATFPILAIYYNIISSREEKLKDVELINSMCIQKSCNTGTPKLIKNVHTDKYECLCEVK